MEEGIELPRPRIAILASGDPESGGGGSTVEYFIRGTQLGACAVEVGLVICNNSESRVGVHKKVAQLNSEYGLNIPVLTINGQTHKKRVDEPWEKGWQTDAESQAICELIQEGDFELIVLMGYMKRVRGVLLDTYGALPSHKSIFEARMINTHPGPLPQTKGEHGIGVQEKVLELGLGYSGHTVHAVAEEYDTGNIYRWRPVLVKPEHTAGTLFDDVQTVEKACLLSDVPDYIDEQRAYLASAA